MQNIGVGVSIFIIKSGKILLLKRKGSHGSGTWCVPGGHQHFGEEPAEAAIRETREETSLTILKPKIMGITNDIFNDAKKHYITIHTYAHWQGGTPVIMEPDKCTEMGWYALDNLPEPLFLSTKNFVRSDHYVKFKDIVNSK